MQAKIFFRQNTRAIFRKAEECFVVDFEKSASTEKSLEELARDIFCKIKGRQITLLNCRNLDSIEVAETFQSHNGNSQG